MDFLDLETSDYQESDARITGKNFQSNPPQEMQGFRLRHSVEKKTKHVVTEIFEFDSREKSTLLALLELIGLSKIR